jgi:cyclopropane fatty-acyl-phospholipid synthase-like methyltransferase
MTRRTSTLNPAYFEAIYSCDADPWRFTSSPYERAKYALTLSALPKPHYKSALEVGCSIGVLSREISSRCESLLSTDAAEAPLLEARRLCADLQNIRFERMFAPSQWPDGRFDLIVLSEIIYFLDAVDVAELAKRVKNSLSPGCDIVLVHWLGRTDYPLTGDEASELFIGNMAGAGRVVHQERLEEFRVDVMTSL